MPLPIQIPPSQVSKVLESVENRNWGLAYYYYMAHVYMGKQPYNQVFANLLSSGGNPTFMTRSDYERYREENREPVTLDFERTVMAKWFARNFAAPWFHQDKSIAGIVYDWSNKIVDFWNWPYGVMEDATGMLMPRGEWFINDVVGEYVITGEPDSNSGLIIEEPIDISIDETIDNEVIDNGEPLTSEDEFIEIRQLDDGDIVELQLPILENKPFIDNFFDSIVTLVTGILIEFFGVKRETEN